MEYRPTCIGLDLRKKTPEVDVVVNRLLKKAATEKTLASLIKKETGHSPENEWQLKVWISAARKRLKKRGVEIYLNRKTRKYTKRRIKR